MKTKQRSVKGMCNSIKLILSTKQEDNEKTEKLLKRLKNRVKIARFSSGQRILHHSELPYIYTDEGVRYFGIGGVEDFVERELALEVGST